MKMTKEELKKEIESCLSDITFSYQGKRAGITSTVDNYIPTYQLWFGDSWKEYSDINDVMNDPFFGNKSLGDIAEETDFQFY